jgi:hypothetical protein
MSTNGMMVIDTVEPTVEMQNEEQASSRPAAREYDYAAILATSQRVSWKLEDIIGGGKKLDWSRPFMPETLAGARLPFLSAAEQLKLNHIRGKGYLYLFGAVEEFILPFVMEHARERVGMDDYETRAFLQFAAEEAKHIHLFNLFRQEFDAGFRTEAKLIGPPEAIAKAVMAHHPLAVALVTLHIEWMTQRHYTDSVQSDVSLDPQFSSLLKNHWLEEAQHAKLDTLMVEAIAAKLGPQEIAKGIEDYAKIGAFLDAGLGQQVQFDVEALEAATARKLGDAEREQLVAAQTRAMRWTFLGSGMTHPRFLATLGRISPEGRRAVEQMAPAFC